jgi:DNA-binding NtrC family response regulator
MDTLVESELFPPKIASPGHPALRPFERPAADDLPRGAFRGSGKGALSGRQLNRWFSGRSRSTFIIAARTPAWAGITEGRFRADLFYRLNVFPIYMPTLRERGSDIILLADHFILKYAKILGKKVKRISTPALDMLLAYHWPGNVRELENSIERAVILAPGDSIESVHLPPSLQMKSNESAKKERGKLDTFVSA